MDISHVYNSYHTLQKANINHNPIFWDCEHLASSQTWIWTAMPLTTHHAPLHNFLGTVPEKKFTSSQGWAATWPPKGSTYHLWSLLPYQSFHLCMAMVFGSSPLSGTTAEYSEVLMSHPWWASLSGQDWDGEGQGTGTKTYRNALSHSHQLLRFLCPTKLVRKTHPNIEVNHHAFSKYSTHAQEVLPFLYSYLALVHRPEDDNKFSMKRKTT